jgi:hypothetical protein
MGNKLKTNPSQITRAFGPLLFGESTVFTMPHIKIQMQEKIIYHSQNKKMVEKKTLYFN